MGFIDNNHSELIKVIWILFKDVKSSVDNGYNNITILFFIPVKYPKLKFTSKSFFYLCYPLITELWEGT